MTQPQRPLLRVASFPRHAFHFLVAGVLLYFDRLCSLPGPDQPAEFLSRKCLTSVFAAVLLGNYHSCFTARRKVLKGFSLEPDRSSPTPASLCVLNDRVR